MGEWGDEEKSPFEALRVTGQAFVRTTDSSEHALMGAGARLAEAARVGSISASPRNSWKAGSLRLPLYSIRNKQQPLHFN